MNYSKEDLLYLPLGGSGEIGMNCNLFHFANKWIMVDLGVTFNNNDSKNYELIMPNIDFIIERLDKLSALILTHAHEDHIGAIPYLIEKLGNVPIYTTSFTASVLKRKLSSVGITNYPINLIEYGKELNIHNFSIEIFCMTHSIPESNALMIKTKNGNIFHSGDWKIDPNPLIGKPINHKKLQNFAHQGVDVMICDSTNIFDQNPSGSEADVRQNLKKIFSKTKTGKIIITCFASNVARVETILDVSESSNKCCLLLGRSLQKIYESAKENNYLLEYKNIVTEKEAEIIPEDNLVVICTGSQGENRAALSRLVHGRHKSLKLNKNDTVIFSSREIPGNEKKINEVKSIVSKLGCTLLDERNSKVHVSGHPSKSELKKMYEWISPKLLIPVHGEYRHLQEHVKFSKKCGIKNQILIENGDLVKLNKDSDHKVLDKVNSGKTVLKGNKVISIDDKFLRELDIISTDGEVFINLIMDLEDKLLAEPVIFSKSILLDEKSKIELIRIIENSIKELSNKSFDDNVLCNELKIDIRSYLKLKIGLKPLTYIEIVRI